LFLFYIIIAWASNKLTDLVTHSSGCGSWIYIKYNIISL